MNSKYKQKHNKLNKHSKVKIIKNANINNLLLLLIFLSVLILSTSVLNQLVFYKNKIDVSSINNKITNKKTNKNLNKNMITGNVLSKARVLNTTQSVCEQNLTQGWNFISTACIKDSGKINSTLAYIYQDYDKIFHYDGSDPTDYWKVYVPNLPSWVKNDINSINDMDGYFVHMIRNQTLIVDGIITSPRSILFYKGYSMVGYPSKFSKDSASAFSNISDKLTIVYWMNNTQLNQTNISAYLIKYINYTVGTSVGNLQTIYPDMGLWFNSSANGVWEVNW